MKRWLSSLLLSVSASVHAQSTGIAKAESNRLLNAALPFAEQMLAEHGEFFPYAQAMDESGKFVAVGASDGRDRPPSKDLIEMLKSGLRSGASAGMYRVTALVYDVRITLPGAGTKSDAIAVSLNHKADYAVLIFIPYRLEGKKVILGEPLARNEENYSFMRRQ